MKEKGEKRWGGAVGMGRWGGIRQLEKEIVTFLVMLDSCNVNHKSSEF